MEADLFNVLNRWRSAGPYTKEELRGLIEEGEFPLSALCLRIGDPEGVRRLSEIFPGMVNEKEEVIEVLQNDEPDETLIEHEVESPESWEDDEQVEDDDENGASEEYEEGSVDMDEIILSMHPHFLSYPRMMLLVFASLLMALIVGVWAARAGDLSRWKWVVPFEIGFFSSVVWLIFLRSRDDYLVTRSRVEAVWGLVARSSKEVRIEDIRRIDVDKDGLLGLLGIGSVEFSSSGTGGFDVAFNQIWRAHRVKGVIRRIMKNPEASRRYLLHGKKFWRR